MNLLREEADWRVKQTEWAYKDRLRVTFKENQVEKKILHKRLESLYDKWIVA